VSENTFIVLYACVMQRFCLILSLLGLLAHDAIALPVGFPSRDNGIPRTAMELSSADCKTVSFGLETLGDVEPSNIATVEYWTYAYFQWVLVSVATEPTAENDWSVKVKVSATPLLGHHTCCLAATSAPSRHRPARARTVKMHLTTSVPPVRARPPLRAA
jgi:hypothetical protein